MSFVGKVGASGHGFVARIQGMARKGKPLKTQV